MALSTPLLELREADSPLSLKVKSDAGIGEIVVIEVVDIVLNGARLRVPLTPYGRPFAFVLRLVGVVSAPLADDFVRAGIASGHEFNDKVFAFQIDWHRFVAELLMVIGRNGTLGFIIRVASRFRICFVLVVRWFVREKNDFAMPLKTERIAH